jgi:hypothetical protein
MELKEYLTQNIMGAMAAYGHDAARIEDDDTAAEVIDTIVTADHISEVTTRKEIEYLIGCKILHIKKGFIDVIYKIYNNGETLWLALDKDIHYERR